jgi:hypothetical protein
MDGQAADLHPEYRLGVTARFIAIARDLDAAELAAPADLHLRLHDARVTHRFRGINGLTNGGGRAPGRHRNAVTCEELLSLVLE